MPLPGEVKFTSSSGRRMDDFLHIRWNGAETCQDSRGVIKSKGDKAAGSTSLHLRPAVRLRRRRYRHHRGELYSGPVNLAAGWPMTFISPTNTAYSDMDAVTFPAQPHTLNHNSDGTVVRRRRRASSPPPKANEKHVTMEPKWMRKSVRLQQRDRGQFRGHPSGNKGCGFWRGATPAPYWLDIQKVVIVQWKSVFQIISIRKNINVVFARNK